MYYNVSLYFPGNFMYFMGFSKWFLLSSRLVAGTSAQSATIHLTFIYLSRIISERCLTMKRLKVSAELRLELMMTHRMKDDEKFSSPPHDAMYFLQVSAQALAHPSLASWPGALRQRTAPLCLLRWWPAGKLVFWLVSAEPLFLMTNVKGILLGGWSWIIRMCYVGKILKS